MKWRYGESNPGPLACEASALPLSYIPERTKNGKNLSLYCLGQANGDWGLIRLHLTEELGRVLQLETLKETEKIFLENTFAQQQQKTWIKI